MNSSPDESSPGVSGAKSEARHHPGLVGASAAAIALTLGVFVYLWIGEGLPSSAWLLPFTWVPLMTWNYLLLRSGRITGIFPTIDPVRSVRAGR